MLFLLFFFFFLCVRKWSEAKCSQRFSSPLAAKNRLDHFHAAWHTDVRKKKEGTEKNSKPCIPDDETDNMVVCSAGLFSLIIHRFYCQKYEAERNKNESAGEEKE